MKAISLHEPYASFIMWGWKTIETRIHQRLKSLVNQRIIIHATKQFIYIQEYFLYMTNEQQEKFAKAMRENKFKNTAGKLLGTVEVTDFAELSGKNSKASMIDCETEKRYGLFLRNPKLFKTPKLYKGHQGIFNVPVEVMKDLEYLKPRKDL